ncbi:uncharacterized protein TM35_000061750 [Trypanosoma theileri]|uniref:Uncharacterized protein n=1 Tax=Trypanosoma theileri TaxID=67003 RepID=A0A1X0P404_9TRYP|nr:uncharacterized protein TM35_000061750 [Trypanosoma theileri]ORC91170.1 hypothetical protein TM35_000061750 [Trypanosoma theileri]
MTDTVDAALAEEVRHALQCLGYRNPSEEDIALTLQHAREAAYRDNLQSASSSPQLQTQPTPSGRQKENSQQESASPPNKVNDVTIAPQDDEETPMPREKCDQGPSSPSLNQWPGLSSRSIRGGRTTPMNSTGTGRQPRRAYAVGNQKTWEYHQQEPYHFGGSVVVEGRPKNKGTTQRQGRCHFDPGSLRHVSRGSRGMIREGVGVTIPTAIDVEELGGYGSYTRPLEYMNPQARLQRHLKRYERGLKEFYVNRHDDDVREDFLREGRLTYDDGDDAEEWEENDEYLGYTDDGEYNRQVLVRNGRRPHHSIAPEMPLRSTPRLVLNQRSANTIYSFTGDSRYKYRGGGGAPLCDVVGPDGSTLRQRSDPVRRGQQMREIWKSDKFLARQRRKDER